MINELYHAATIALEVDFSRRDESAAGGYFGRGSFDSWREWHRQSECVLGLIERGYSLVADD